MTAGSGAGEPYPRAVRARADHDERLAALREGEAEARRLTLRRDAARPLGTNLEEGARLAKQATTLVGFARNADDDATA